MPAQQLPAALAQPQPRHSEELLMALPKCLGQAVGGLWATRAAQDQALLLFRQQVVGVSKSGARQSLGCLQMRGSSKEHVVDLVN